MSRIYFGTGYGRKLVGECTNGHICTGAGMFPQIIGSYTDDRIYRGTGLNQELIGEYRDGRVYRGVGFGAELIGEYKDGRVYRGVGWGAPFIGEYEGTPAGAAALLLLPELENSTLSCPSSQIEESSNSTSERANASVPSPGCLFLSLPAIGIVLLVLLISIGLLTFSYNLYTGTIKWTKWSYYALFFDCLLSFIAANISIVISYRKAKTSSDFKDSALFFGLGGLVVLSLILASIIYIVELYLDKTLTFWTVLSGIIVVPVDLFVFILPFFVAEIIIVLICQFLFRKEW